MISKAEFWYQVDAHIQSVPRVHHDALMGSLVACLAQLGVEGTEDLSNETMVAVRFFLHPSIEVSSFVKRAQDLLKRRWPEECPQGTISFETVTIEEKDWMEEWKKSFDVLRLSDHIIICPSWKTYAPQKDECVIHMDPGMAFGTGHHPSTQMIAQAMEDQIFEYLRMGIKPTVLDVGTGTGVLAIGAVLLGALKAVGTDNDPEALMVAWENVQGNECTAKISIEDTSLDQMRRKFHLVVANILAEVHVELMPFYLKRIEENGTILLSGIVDEREHIVQASLTEHGWVIVNKRVQKEWVCLTARRERRKKTRS